MSSEQQPDAITLGELIRTLTAFKEDVRDDFNDLRDQLGRLNHVHADVYAADRVADGIRHKAVVDRLERLEQSLRRAVNLAVTAFIAPIAVAAVLYLLIGSR